MEMSKAQRLFAWLAVICFTVILPAHTMLIGHVGGLLESPDRESAQSHAGDHQSHEGRSSNDADGHNCVLCRVGLASDALLLAPLDLTPDQVITVAAPLDDQCPPALLLPRPTQSRAPPAA